MLVLFLKFLLLSAMSFYYAYVLQLAGTCSNWCQTLLMKGAWAMKLMYLKDVLPSGEQQAGGFSLHSWVGLQEVQFVWGGVPSEVYSARPMGVFSSSNEASRTREFHFKTGSNERVLAEGTGICTLQWDKKVAETTFYFRREEMLMAKKKITKRHVPKNAVLDMVTVRN